MIINLSLSNMVYPQDNPTGGYHNGTAAEQGLHEQQEVGEISFGSWSTGFMKQFLEVLEAGDVRNTWQWLVNQCLMMVS